MRLTSIEPSPRLLTFRGRRTFLSARDVADPKLRPRYRGPYQPWCPWRARRAVFSCVWYYLKWRRRRLFKITDTLLRDIATLAIMGLSSQPVKG